VSARRSCCDAFCQCARLINAAQHRRLRAASSAAALEADGLKLAPSEQNGGFRLSQYGPLYTLKPRRNELLLRVSLS